MSKSAIILIVILILPWIGVIIYKLTKKSRSLKYYRKLKEKYELTEKANGKNIPVFEGVYRSRTVNIENKEYGAKKKLSTQLTVRCENPADFEITLVKRSRANNSVYSADSSPVDDEEFDKLFFVHTNNPERVKKLFDFNTRFKLQQVNDLGFNGIISLTGNEFTYTEPGTLNSDTAVMRFELVLHELCDLADVMKYN